MSDPVEVKMDIDLLEEFPILKLSKEERHKLFVDAFDRGSLGARLHVDVPPGIHYEWVRNDPIQIQRLKGLGYQLGTKYFNKALNTDGSGNPVVGDVILMICPQEIKDQLDKVAGYRYARDNAEGTNRAKEDIEGRSLLEGVGPSEYVPVLPLSSQLSRITGDEAQS